MPPGQVSRGQGGTGLPFPTRFLSLWRKRDNGKSSGDRKSNSDKDNAGSNNESNSGGGSSGFSPGTSSGSVKSQTPSPVPPPCFGPCVPDNDPRVIYSTSWSLIPHGFFQTSHLTDVAGSSLSLNFTGTGITVFGSIPASNATHLPPTAAYSVDAAAPVVTVEPLATNPVLNQPLFSKSGLANGTHTLVIQVLNVSSASPFAVDYFIVKPPTAAAFATSSASASASALSTEKDVVNGSTKGASKATVGVLAGVFGVVVFILLCVIAFFIVIIRRRQRRALRSKRMQSSLFTSPESIVLYSRESSSHCPASLNPWRSVVGKSWVTTKSTSEKSPSGQTSCGGDVATIKSYG